MLARFTSLGFLICSGSLYTSGFLSLFNSLFLLGFLSAV